MLSNPWIVGFPQTHAIAVLGRNLRTQGDLTDWQPSDHKAIQGVACVCPPKETLEPNEPKKVPRHRRIACKS
jgi:hypothetical protein